MPAARISGSAGACCATLCKWAGSGSRRIQRGFFGRDILSGGQGDVSKAALQRRRFFTGSASLKEVKAGVMALMCQRSPPPPKTSVGARLHSQRAGPGAGRAGHRLHLPAVAQLSARGGDAALEGNALRGHHLPGAHGQAFAKLTERLPLLRPVPLRAQRHHLPRRGDPAGQRAEPPTARPRRHAAPNTRSD